MRADRAAARGQDSRGTGEQGRGSPHFVLRVLAFAMLWPCSAWWGDAVKQRAKYSNRMGSFV